MFNFAQAQVSFAAARKYHPLGARIARDVYMKYDAELQQFELAYVYSKMHEMATDKLGYGRQWARAKTSERHLYTMKTFARITQERVHVFPPENAFSSLTARKMLNHLFGCSYSKPSTIMVKGVAWTTSAAPLDPVFSGNGVFIYPDGRIVPDSPHLLRTHLKEEQLALNRKLKEVRRLVKLRIKLGAFSSIDWVQVGEDFVHEHGKASASWHIKETFPKIFASINSEDYKTMLPFLYLGLVNELGNSFHLYSFRVEAAKSADLNAVMDKVIGTIREHLRRVTGAVEYVPAY